MQFVIPFIMLFLWIKLLSHISHSSLLQMRTTDFATKHTGRTICSWLSLCSQKENRAHWTSTLWNISLFFFRNTVQTQDADAHKRARILSLWIHARNPTPMSTSERLSRQLWIFLHTQPYPYEHLRETEPANPRDWRSHHRRSAVDGNVAYHWKHKRR